MKTYTKPSATVEFVDAEIFLFTSGELGEDQYIKVKFDECF